MKNKKIIIITCTIILLILIIIIGITKSTKNKENTSAQTSQETIELSQVFEIEDIEKSKVTISKSTNEQIATKYLKGVDVNIVDAKIKFSEQIGKMIYVRESYNNINIFKTTYKIDEGESIATQVAGYMETFKQMCKDYIGLEYNQEPKKEILYEEDQGSIKIPLEESIYLENKLYSLTYEQDNQEKDTKKQEYDINFYREGNDLVAEFVKIL